MKLQEAQALIANSVNKRLKAEVYITEVTDDMTLISVPIPPYAGFVDSADPTQLQICLTNKRARDIYEELKKHFNEPRPKEYI